MASDKKDIKSMFPDELEEFLAQFNQPKYRAAQIFKWLHRDCAEDFEQMSNIPKELKILLDENSYITVPKTVTVKRSSDGTVKYLREFNGGSTAESVLMRYCHGNTVCVSSQSGCRMGCAFCASTLNGLERNLTPSEIIDQVIFMQKQENAKISNIVLMGTGEPLDNYDNVLRFLKLIRLKDGAEIGHRHISLSTCGLADKISRLADEHLQITLSVSLHAPFDEIRSQIMPVNKAFPLKVLLEACKEYFRKTSRRISFEYAMINNMNDNDECARQLSKIAKSVSAHINLIPLNKVSESGLSGSSHARVLEFQKMLQNFGANATIRRRLGSDIDASCGQLRNMSMNKRKAENK